MIRTIIISLVFVGTLVHPAHSQDERAPHFFGVNPSITVEPFYEKGEFDINVFPLVYQRPVSLRTDFRVTSIINLGIRNTGTAISHYGLETAAPFFLTKREVITEPSKGFFLAPIVSVTRNRMEEHTNLGLWLEPGYNLLFENKWALSFGLQLGSTYFQYDVEPSTWDLHMGVKVILGRWW